MVAGAQAAARRPPRLLGLAVLLLLAMASFYFIFLLLGMQVVRDYQGPGSVRSRSYEKMPRSVTFQRMEVESDQQQGMQHDRVWSPVRSLRQLLPYAAPRNVSFRAPVFPGSGFLFTTIKGELHEIHAAVCDFVAIARLLDATIVLPKIQGTTSVRGGGHSKVESFHYLYDEHHFMTALKEDVRVVTHLPKQFRSRARLLKQPVKTPTRGSSVQYFLNEVLPALATHGACGLVFSDGGGLQSVLPPELVEYQRLRCRVAFQALRFRTDIQGLGVRLVRRLEARGRPYVVVHLGLEKDVLAHHGCAELFQDLQTESIQLQRNHFLTSGEELSELHIDSQKQRHKGLCPLMPAEVGLLLEAYGFGHNTTIYLIGSETTGGQRLLLHLRSMYANLEDRFTLSTSAQRAILQPKQRPYSISSSFGRLFMRSLKKMLLFWVRTKRGPFVRASWKGWWRRVGDCESHTEDYFMAAATTMEDLEGVEAPGPNLRLRMAAVDYLVALEANTYFPAFDRNRQGLPSLASLIMGHRLYQSAALKTFRPNRSALVALLDAYPHEDAPNVSSWRLLVRQLLTESLIPPEDAKSGLFLSYPIPECTCLAREFANSRRQRRDGGVVWEGVNDCPNWMVTQ